MEVRQLHKFSRAIVLAQSEHYIAAATGVKLHVCEKDSFQEIARFDKMKNGYDIYIPRDEKRIIVASFNPWIYVWSLENPEDSKRIRVAKGEEYVHDGRAALSLDGKRLYAIIMREDACCDKIVELDLETYKVNGCYFAEDMFIFTYMIPLEDGTYYVTGFERGEEENDYFLAKFDGSQLTDRRHIKNDANYVRYYEEHKMLTWYDSVEKCVMCYDGKNPPEVLAKWYKSFDYFTRTHYYDVKRNLLFMQSDKGLYVIDTLKEEIIDYTTEIPEIREFLWRNGKVHVYDVNGVLYEIEGIGENAVKEMPEIDRVTEKKEEYVPFDFTISDEMKEQFAELRRRFEMQEPYHIEEALREEILKDAYLLQSVGARYKEGFDTLAARIYTESTSVQYGTLGSHLNRGFYNPSIIQENVCSEVRRGKLLKRITSNTERYFKYHFNADGQLIIVERYLNETCLEVEFILREERVEYGLKFDTRPMNGVERLSYLSMQRFDEEGRSLRYMECTVYQIEEEESEYCFFDLAEQYEYDGNEVAFATAVKGNVKEPECTGDRYKVTRNAKGKYKIQEI